MHLPYRPKSTDLIKEQTLPYGYVVASIDVQNPEHYKDYVKMVLPTIEHYGGEFLARGGKAESFENNAHGSRHVIIRFPSYQKAQDWYHSDEYAPAKKHRMSASSSVQTIVEGV